MQNQITIRWQSTTHEARDRILGLVLTTVEAEHARDLVGGLTFPSLRSPDEMLAALETEGFERGCDIISITAEF